jgi:hypothetical protein
MELGVFCISNAVFHGFFSYSTMDEVTLNPMPAEVKAVKKLVAKTVFHFIRGCLQGKSDEVIPKAPFESLKKKCEANVMEVGRTVASAMIQGIYG